MIQPISSFRGWILESLLLRIWQSNFLDTINTSLNVFLQTLGRIIFHTKSSGVCQKKTSFCPFFHRWSINSSIKLDFHYLDHFLLTSILLESVSSFFCPETRSGMFLGCWHLSCKMEWGHMRRWSLREQNHLKICQCYCYQL